MYRVLIIEDDDKIRDLLASYLHKYDFNVSVVEDFRHIKETVQQLSPDLILLDINLPYYDGFYWCRIIRTFSLVPVIFITARVGEMDQVLAIENGGDDYITKPFHMDVVMAKINSVLRRTYGEYSDHQQPRHMIQVQGLCLYVDKHQVEWKGKRVDLTHNETILLQMLLEHYDRIVSREALLSALWDDHTFVDDNTLTVNVTRVRKKLREIGIKEAIQTHRGKGYRFALHPEKRGEGDV
ncbi:two component transcriptional regulator, winged helix family [Caldalkalibacillus thermarum TA2.A1]|uniref:Response regulator transcription factor n=1 Tax=Caldalkalibacillus thermarum (strain TA2.A1) TaxID=986075 RepID=F5L7W5_CALTT|nr:response regulator transcription factor [Caldalkalibacillus thermarum]EGL82553.1 two component transcriptional regulator, winged helix family [Caldalkalibacillus thermarum TA2.A1]QZT34794.1 response regulator transcription factor [Caldalkalibacillus thermarum TA2.A1]